MMKTRILFAGLMAGCLACAQPSTSESNSSEESRPVTTLPASDDDQTHNDVPDENEGVSESSMSTEAETNGIAETRAMVYVTTDGDKYHTADCRYSKTAHAVALSTAKAEGKTACGVCKPSSTTGQKQVRCAGTTSEGKQCQRLTSDASGKCFQHREGD